MLEAMKVYTRLGDKGQTSLVGGKRVSKSDLRLDVYGTVDEANSVAGLIEAEIKCEQTRGGQPHVATDYDFLLNHISKIQSSLFDIGSHLACDDLKLRATMPVVSDEDINNLEKWMDLYSKDLPALKHFILPGGAKSAGFAHLARTVTRRAERLCVQMGETQDVEAIVVKYLNRLSDYFFVLARKLNQLASVPEVLWEPAKR
jgi:cob(I)alamin adenosyltransferase